MTIEDYLKLIEHNCKNQFMLHRFWFWSRAANLAMNNGKFTLAIKALEKLQRLARPLDRGTGLADATNTIDNFVHAMYKAIENKRGKPAYS